MSGFAWIFLSSGARYDGWSVHVTHADEVPAAILKPAHPAHAPRDGPRQARVSKHPGRALKMTDARGATGGNATRTGASTEFEDGRSSQVLAAHVRQHRLGGGPHAVAAVR